MSTIGPFRAAGQAVPSRTEVVDAIRQASERAGVDFKFMLAKAQTESSLDPNIRARTSSASGLYQFIESTWLNTVRQHGAKYGIGDLANSIEDDFGGAARVRDSATRKQILDLRFDPKIASAMAAEFTKSNLSQLEGALGSGINSTDLYLAHFLGANGASRFLQNYRNDPQKIGASLFPEAANANRGVFYDPSSGRARTLGQIYDFFSKKMGEEIATVDTVDRESVPAPPGLAPRRPASADWPPQLQALAAQFGLKGTHLRAETVMAFALLAEPLLGNLRGGLNFGANASGFGSSAARSNPLALAAIGGASSIAGAGLSRGALGLFGTSSDGDES